MICIESPTVCDSNGNYFQKATSRFACAITDAYDLILMAESEESPRDKIVKSGLEAKGLKMN